MRGYWFGITSFVAFAWFPADACFGQCGFQEQQKLILQDGERYDYFGRLVRGDGDVVVMGMPDAVTYNGTALVFRRVDGSWSEEQELNSSASQDAYAFSVAIDGDVIAVGAFFAHDSRGAVYVYRFDGSSWKLEQELVADDASSGAYFGRSVAVRGDAIVVGAYGDAHARGTAYVFRYRSLCCPKWVQQQKLTPSDGSNRSGHGFGDSVSLSLDVLVIGAPYDPHSGFASGSAYTFRFDGTSWVEEQKLVGDPGSFFGGAVGAGAGIFALTSLDGAHLYHFDGSAWQEQRFPGGESIAASDDVVLIGFPDDDGGVGGVYRFVAGAWTLRQEVAGRTDGWESV